MAAQNITEFVRKCVCILHSVSEWVSECLPACLPACLPEKYNNKTYTQAKHLQNGMGREGEINNKISPAYTPEYGHHVVSRLSYLNTSVLQYQATANGR